MAKKSNVFQDSNGNGSSARVGAFAIIIIACFLASWIVIADKEYLQAAGLFSAMTGTAITLYILGKQKDNQALQLELDREGLKSMTTK